MNDNNIKEVLSENLGEGYRIVRDDGKLSSIIEWVDWVNQSKDNYDEENFVVEVHFDDGSVETFEKGIKVRQISNKDC